MSTESLRKVGSGIAGTIATVFSLSGYISLIMKLAPLLNKWNAIEAGWDTVAGLQERLTTLLDAGEVIADMTETDADDKFVDQLRPVAGNTALLEVIAGVIKWFKQENPAASPAGLLAFVEREDVQAKLTADAAEKAIDFSTIMEAIKLIIQLVSLFKSATGSGGTSGTSGDSAWNF